MTSAVGSRRDPRTPGVVRDAGDRHPPPMLERAADATHESMLLSAAGDEHARPADHAGAPRVVLHAVRVGAPLPGAGGCQRRPRPTRPGSRRWPARLGSPARPGAPGVMQDAGARRPPPVLERTAGATRKGVLLSAAGDEHARPADHARSPTCRAARHSCSAPRTSAATSRAGRRPTRPRSRRSRSPRDRR